MDAVGLALNIVEIVKILKQTYETLKDAPAALEEVIAQANSLAALVKRLDSIEPFLSDDRKHFLASQFDSAACANTVRELRILVDKISQHDDGTEKTGFKMKQRVLWFLKQSSAEKLSERMKAHCTQIANATDQILLECGLFMEKQLVELREAMLKQSKPIIATAQSTLAETQETPILLGQIRLKQGQTLAMPYFHDRHELSDSAYLGHWDRLLTHNLARGNKAYKQNWINASRIMRANDRSEPSGFTPLHQAAWHGASTSVVEKLILLGAWRLARTVRNGRMQTALDVAKESGWAHLYSLLMPVVHHTLPASVLLGLQDQLNQLYAAVFPGATEYHVVPQVEILTELKDPQLLVPLEAEIQNVGRPVGMHLYLDERELVAQVVKTDGAKAVYRIRKDGWKEIDRGILLRSQRG